MQVSGNAGPVQVVTGNSSANMHVENSSFSNTMKMYREVMMKYGISKEDIDTVINYPNNEDIKKSFLSKYGLDLTKITVSIAGTAVKLYDILSK